ncbi:MAG: hypothetical protein RQ735_08125 [Flavobacteriaceae bacterium]|nr:hypothetical protein [Flavobacteriaceae bacterium]
MTFPRSWISIALFNLAIAASFGLLLRSQYLFALPFQYRFVTHAHSHVAMLGWVYLVLFACIVCVFIPEDLKKFKKLFWVTQFSVIGMMCSFPFQGYAVFSIIFSTLHIFCSYAFVLKVWPKLRPSSQMATRFLKTAFILMLISTGGVWSLGPIMASGGNGSAAYHIAIQTFLHLQFNGWFLFAVLAIFIKICENKGIVFLKRNVNGFLISLILATVFTLALPISWFWDANSLGFLNTIGVFSQFAALFIAIKIFLATKFSVPSKPSNIIRAALILGATSFILKIVLQLFSIFPKWALRSFQIKNFVIGFIHLTMLGLISGFLFYFIFQVFSKLAEKKVITFGFYLFIVGFVLSETWLFVQGFMFYLGYGLLPAYYEALFATSILLWFGILLIFVRFSFFCKKDKTESLSVDTF